MSLGHESLRHDGGERLSSSRLGGVARPRAEDSHELLQLQRLAGNRAVTALIGGPGVLQRNNGTTEEKRERLKGGSTHRDRKEKDPRAAFATHAARILRGEIPDSEVTPVAALRAVLWGVWDNYATLDRAAAKDNCEEAADKISHRLRSHGINGEWVGVAWWGPSGGAGSSNHYVIVVQDLVIDATGQQFVGGKASITPYSEWVSELESRIPPPMLARYVRGSRSQAQSLASDINATYFSKEGKGQPLHVYDPEVIAKAKARVPSRESDEAPSPRLKIKGRSDARE